jgi:hypothetical protein
MNYEFLALYEELSKLNESKSDLEKLHNFAPGGAAELFFKLRKNIKSPENDVYYWIKNKTPEEFSDFVFSLEKEYKAKSVIGGANLVAENEYWKVYHITTYEASEKYGRDTKWCVAGNNGSGQKYWETYIDIYGASLYYFITKKEYDPRGIDSKYAVSYYGKGFYEIWDQQDGVAKSIPNAPRVPGIEEDFTVPITFDDYLYQGGIIGNSKVYRKYLTKVTIQDGITELPYRAFISC